MEEVEGLVTLFKVEVVCVAECVAEGRMQQSSDLRNAMPNTPGKEVFMYHEFDTGITGMRKNSKRHDG